MVLLKRPITAISTSVMLTLAVWTPAVFADDISALKHRNSDSQVTPVSYEAPTSGSRLHKLSYVADSEGYQSSEESLCDESALTWTTEIESTYLRPSINGNSQGEMSYGLFEAPRVSLGTNVGDYQIRASFWQMNADEELNTYSRNSNSGSNQFIYPASYNVFFDEVRDDNIFEAYILDLEASRTFDLERFSR